MPVNDDWRFTKENVQIISAAASAKWQAVNLPHTWNADDVMDDVPGYYRGVGWYWKKLSLDKKLQGKNIFLFFEGANQETTVFLNGKKAGDHTGGYTAFNIDITALIDWNKENELLVRVDNSYNQDIPPLSADFTFYGGIYRKVSLVALDPVHFSCNENGSNALFISTPTVNDKNAVVNIRGTISNTRAEIKKIKISSSIYTANGKKMAEVTGQMLLEPGINKMEQTIQQINHPRLWSPDDPYLYKIITKIIDEATGKTMDEIINPLGFRWFHFDAGKGFFLNGKPCKLVGTSRHQDYKGMGNAVPRELAIKDVEWLKKMGGNFLRVAHYPQDPVILQACDSIGILASVEIPIVNEITESENFDNNCRTMQVEMIRQNYNHPSVIIWCSMNEVLLRPHYNNDKEKQKIYFDAITRLAKSLDSITRIEDPYRYTMIAYHGDYNRYRAVGLVDIPMIAGWNLYSGWYGAALNDFPAFLDAFHKDYPDKPMVVSEYGADADPRIRSIEPVRFDKSLEYTTRFHQYYLTEMLKRPFVAAAMIWNLADFNSETRTESMPHINNKGLLTWDRIPKDPYYYYQGMLSKTPFIKILGTEAGEAMADSASTHCLRLLQVAANTAELELIVNGQSAGKRTVENGLCEWNIPFINGSNSIEVKGQKDGKWYSDKAIIQFNVQPYKLDNATAFRQLNILLGANRYFTDEEQQVWIPDQEYREGSWGHIGGSVFKIKGNNRLPYGTDKNIAGTNDDPVYQTQQIGIEKYRLDLPPGEYELTLHFAELIGGQVKELPYNLSNNDRIEPNGERIFDVYINGKLMLGNFNITAQYGASTAVAKKIRLNVEQNSGVEIYFKPIEAEPVLNALQVKRISDNQKQVVK
jgi:beta-galactosidase